MKSAPLITAPLLQLRRRAAKPPRLGRNCRVVEHCEDHARHKSFAARRYAGVIIEHFRPD